MRLIAKGDFTLLARQLLPYDIFIAYSRRDKAHSWVTFLLERISSEFETFAGQPRQQFLCVEIEL